MPETRPQTPVTDDASALYYGSLTDVAGMIRDGDVSPVELCQFMLDRIERVDIQPLEGTRLDDLLPTALICAQETDIKVSVQVPEGGV